MINKKNNSRYFTRENGFKDNTKYVEIDSNNKIWFITKDGSREPQKPVNSLTLSDCERFVEEGSWIEITNLIPVIESLISLGKTPMLDKSSINNKSTKSKFEEAFSKRISSKS